MPNLNNITLAGLCSCLCNSGFGRPYHGGHSHWHPRPLPIFFYEDGTQWESEVRCAARYAQWIDFNRILLYSTGKVRIPVAGAQTLNAIRALIINRKGSLLRVNVRYCVIQRSIFGIRRWHLDEDFAARWLMLNIQTKQKGRSRGKRYVKSSGRCSQQI